MTLLRPGALWLLLLAIPILLLHLRMRRRVRLVVPSLLLFEGGEARAARPRGPGFRPRDLAGLLLEWGALGCLALAAAGPVEGSPPPEPRPVALVLDATASMAAGGRLGDALDLAERVLAAAGEEAPVTLVLAAREPRVVVTAGEPRARVGAALADLRRHGVLVAGGGALAAAAEAAVASGAEVTVITDGCDPDAPALADRADLRLLSVGRPLPNGAVTGLAAEARRGGPGILVLEVRDPEGGRREVDLSGAWNAAVREGTGPFLATRGEGGEDALPLDDALVLAPDPTPPLRIAVLAPGGRAEPWLAAALEASADLLDGAGSVVVDPAGLAALARPPEVLVVLGTEPPPGLPALVLGGGAGDPSEAPAVAGGDLLHPVMRGVDPAEWMVTRGRLAPALAGDAVLLSGPRGPLAVASERGGVRRVLLAFDPRESTLPLSGAWPVLVRNALLWLSRDGERPLPHAVKAGEEVLLRLPGVEGSVEVEGPVERRGADPLRLSVPVRDGVARFRVPPIRESGEAGFRVRLPDGRVHRSFAGLLDAGESDLTPRVAWNGAGFVAPPRPPRGAEPRSRAADFALGGALLLLLEWLLFLAAAQTAPRRDSFPRPVAAP